MKTIAEQLNITEFPFRIKDSNGNEIYCEYSNGFWRKAEYDANGNKIYFEGSGGFWFKSEYDAYNNEIYYQNSDGYWLRRQYDANGNKIYFEDSRGEIEDKRSKPCEDMVVEINGAKYLLTKI
jgi:glucan-binding YG repeat protein